MIKDLEKTLWATADKLRNNMDAAEYKHIVLGLIFLKYISDSFKELYQSLSADPLSDAEDLTIMAVETVIEQAKLLANDFGNTTYPMGFDGFRYAADSGI